jgi:type I restriction enzyme S subunit
MAADFGNSPISFPNDWQLVRLGDITKKIGSGATPTGGEDSYLRERTRFALVRSQNVFDRRFDSAGLAFISDGQARRLQGVALQAGDLLLNITGDGVTFARACAIPVEILPACVNQHVAIVRVDDRIADPGYVLAYLTHPEVKSYVESFNAGGSRRAITKGHIESFVLPLPPLPEQSAIAHILGTLDERMELNRRMNKTLEAMAQALFKSWFVDFDPVRAKAQGRDSGLAKPIADLFPDRLEASELGNIPAGWTVGRLGDVAKHMRRGVQPSDIDPVTPYIALDHMPRRSIALAEWATANGLESSKFEFQRGEILFGKLRPYFHKVGVAPLDGVCSTDIVVLAPSEETWFGFVLGHASSGAFVDYADSRSTGTKMPRTNWTEMAGYPVALPPEVVSEALTEQIQPVVERIIAGIHESRSLAAIRDMLLPKLISGEVRVRQAERMLEAAPA